ncbi:MAG: hypothetical protein QGH45_04195, partial [Myxococcota bacterium]|nr:hypothetical protein [Myxococcota bacterium]
MPGLWPSPSKAPLDAPALTPSELQGRWLDEWTFPPIRKRRDDEPVFAALDAGQLQDFHGGLAFDPAILLCHVIARCVDTGTRAALPAVSPDDLRDLLEDSRDGLVASGDVHAYLRVLLFLHDLRDQVTDPEWRAEVDRVLVQGNTRPTLRLLLAAVGRGDAAPADVLFALRGMAELEPTWLADALAETPDEEGRVAVADAVVDLADLVLGAHGGGAEFGEPAGLGRGAGHGLVDAARPLRAGSAHTPAAVRSTA